MEPEATRPDAGCPTCYALVVAVLPSRIGARNDPGHAWLEWSPGEGPHPPYRGYWPDLDDPDLPDDCVPGSRELHRWLRTHSVRGLRRVDFTAIEWRARHGAQLVELRTPLTLEERVRLEQRCWIPPDTYAVREGRYSWEEEREDCDNCSSWALKVARQVAGDRIPLCDRPNKLWAVIAAISGCARGARAPEEGASL
jgi:hypothetical protein